MNRDELAEVIKHSNLQLSDVIYAVNRAQGREAVNLVACYANEFSPAEIETGRTALRGETVSAQTFFYNVRGDQPTHGDAVRAGRQLKTLFRYIKAGSHSLYVIE